MNKQILVLNSGSSSIKFRLFDADVVTDELKLELKGQIEGLGDTAHFMAKKHGESIIKDLASDTNHEAALEFLLHWLNEHLDKRKPLIVGHRVVHGGNDFTQPMLITPEIIQRLRLLNPLAPLHQPHNLAAIEVLQKLKPDLQQVACFDTAFHAGHAKEIEQFALPREISAEGVRRYGFHGLSYEFIAKELRQIDPHLAQGKVLVAHLGNGASLCALDNGRSVDSSMGFSALDGLVMGTRSGSIDAGVLLYLMQEKKYSAKKISDLLYKQSGLLGVSGISNDMRVLLASQEKQASEAISLYVQRIARECGALCAILEGFDGIVFTGGVGENSAPIREKVSEKLAWLGLQIDAQKNNQTHGSCAKISTEFSRASAYVIPTNEELMIAQHTLDLIN